MASGDGTLTALNPLVWFSPRDPATLTEDASGVTAWADKGSLATTAEATTSAPTVDSVTLPETVLDFNQAQPDAMRVGVFTAGTLPSNCTLIFVFDPKVGEDFFMPITGQGDYFPFIGQAGPDNNLDSWTGDVLEMRVYNRELTEDEIADRNTYLGLKWDESTPVNIVGTAVGSSTLSAVGAAEAAAMGSAAAIDLASAVGAARFSGNGNAAGTAIATADPAVAINRAGLSAGTSLSSAVGRYALSAAGLSGGGASATAGHASTGIITLAELDLAIESSLLSKAACYEAGLRLVWRSRH